MTSVKFFSRETGWLGGEPIKFFTTKTFIINNKKHLPLIIGQTGEYILNLKLNDESELNNIAEKHKTWYLYLEDYIITSQLSL